MSGNIILIRHGQSLWNHENKFTGITDINLSSKGIEEAINAQKLIQKLPFQIDYAFTSNLNRAIRTCELIVDKNIISIQNNKALNERDYGDLTGKNKKEIENEYGMKNVHDWRRGFFNKPPNGENLEEVCNRVSIYYNSNIKPLLAEKNILIVAHGNSLRALMVVLGLFDEKEIEHIDIPTGIPYIIGFEKNIIIKNNYLNSIQMKGRQILDSRGNPTIEVDIYKNNHLIARESSPSGASTGTNEAYELRDKESKIYLGKGVNKCVSNVSKFNSSLYISEELLHDQIRFDKEICKIDGTNLKHNLGGNTTTALSFAAASASSNLNNIQLFQHLKNVYNNKKTDFALPTPMVNILNGGKHAGGNLQIQEFMIMPKEDISFKNKLQNIVTVYHTLGKILVKKYGISSKNLGDEGGFAPQLETPEEALEIIEEAIKQSGFIPGKDIFLALDCASSEYYNKKTKTYEVEKNKFLTNIELVEYYQNLIQKHPSLKSIEDPFDEFDYEGWKIFTEKMSNSIMIVGDDLFTTNFKSVQQGLDNKWANSLLLKVNQIGTISEAVEAANLLFENDLNVVVSHRSGETTGTLISDLCVAIGAKYIKIGAPARGERVAKYNRLLQIEDYLINFQ